MTFSGAGRFIVTVHGLTAWQMTHTAGHGPLLLLNMGFCPRPQAWEARRL